MKNYYRNTCIRAGKTKLHIWNDCKRLLHSVIIMFWLITFWYKKF